MSKCMLIDALHPEETRVVITDDRHNIEEFDFITTAKKQIKGNIYLAKVTRVEPSLQAAFVEYGGDKQGFLSFSEVHPDYYQIPVADRQKLLEEQDRLNREEAEKLDREEEEEEEDKGKKRTRRRTRRSSSRGGKKDNAAEADAGDDSAEDAVAAADTDEAASDDDDKPKAKKTRTRRRRTPAAKKSQDLAADAISTSSDVIDEDEESDEPAETPDTIETASEEEEIEQARSKSTNFSKRYKIQEVVKRGQIMLVQVVKEERGNKGVSLTTYISLAGRYCVLMPNSSKEGGISRKIGKHDERKRLRSITSELRDKRGMSAIIRTAGIGRTKAEIKRDYEYLIKQWSQIREDALAASAPALVYEESNILKRSIRDYYNADIEKVMVQGDEAYKTAKEFMKMIMPSHAPRVKQYKEITPLFSAYDVESQLQSMYQPEAKMRSGGYVVINHTEALISIDVNTGKSTTERNVEETALKTNLEAAAEIARQLRLRDLGGLIVIDFIDMFYGRNRRAVERAFKDALKSDRAKIQVGHISPFGLLELSRQRIRPSLSETTTNSCPHCHGTGLIRSKESLSIEIVRILEEDASSGNYRELRVSVSPELAVFMLNQSRKHLTQIEETYGVTIIIKSEHELTISEYSIEKIQHSGNREKMDSRTNNGKRESRRGSRGGRRSRGGRNRDRRGQDAESDAPEADAEDNDSQMDANDADDATAEEDAPKRSSRRRGSRGGKKEDGRSRRGGRRGGKRKDEDDAPSDDGDTAQETVEDSQPETANDSADTAPAPEPKKETASAVSNVIAIEEEEDDDRPKRKGWWSKVVS